MVSKDELAKVSSNNLLSALQVFDPSFRLKDNVDMGSNPNSMPNFRIRGNSGFGAEGLSEANLKNDPNLPTFILDGYEVDVEKIFDLNMDRIESDDFERRFCHSDLRIKSCQRSGGRDNQGSAGRPIEGFL